MPDVPDSARKLAGEFARCFERDRELVGRLIDAKRRLGGANGELWWDPLDICVFYGLDGPPPAAEVRVPENRSEVLDAQDPMEAIQQAHRRIEQAFSDYQAAAEERRQLAYDLAEHSRALIAELIAAGWSEAEARNANVHKVAGLR